MELATTSVVSDVNPDIGDLALSDEGTEIAYTSLVEEVAQRLRVRLSSFKGDWFLNLNSGIPFYERVFVKGVDEGLIRSIFYQAILGTAGVSNLISLTYSHDKATRVLSIAFSVRLIDGSVFSSKDFPPYVLAL